jgi:RHS repeat-associated protein
VKKKRHPFETAYSSSRQVGNDSFGNIIATSGSLVNSFRYTGREFDTETSLYYYRSRYYDPSLGRFMREDPMRFTGGINFYAYVKNRPVDRVDPLGLWPSMGDIWNWGKKVKDGWDTATKYADKIGCYAAYYYCIQTTFDNAKCQNNASGNNVTNTITPNDLQNPPGSLGWKNVQDAVAGNPNCEKALKDCLAPLISGGMFPH